jgi:phenylalanyl-tRNA synthetase beta chain
LPVLKIQFSRLERMTGLSRERILDRLPYIGLDIEGTDKDSVRIEYNPNRPDFSTDYGIARALRGLVGKETGLRTYRALRGRNQVFADEGLANVRPFIACAVARGLALDEETIRQLISMQEDLHNGLGRKRRKVAIGLHDLGAIKFPVFYSGKDSRFSFVPLGSEEEMTLQEILARTETGQAYGRILAGARVYPVLSDSRGVVLSFPPIINGTRTKVETGTRDLFVDVTSTDERLGREALAIICCALADAGATLETVTVNYGRYDAEGEARVEAKKKKKKGEGRKKVNKKRSDGKKGTTAITPDLSPTRMRLDPGLAQAITGLTLSKKQVRDALRRSRLDLDAKGFAEIPAYRVDILHPIDLTEDIVVGYGLDRMKASYPPSGDAGRFDPRITFVEAMCFTMAEAGFIETMNFDLVDEPTLYTRFGRGTDLRLEVDNPRSMEHYLLRDSLLPSLMAVLGRNTKNEYPHRIFEAGKVFKRSGDGLSESSALAALSAHSSSSFTEAKSNLEALVTKHFGVAAETRPASHWAFAEGRCAQAFVKGVPVGYLGEVRPTALAAFGVDVPVCGFELDLSTVGGWKVGRKGGSGGER